MVVQGWPYIITALICGAEAAATFQDQGASGSPTAWAMSSRLRCRRLAARSTPRESRSEWAGGGRRYPRAAGRPACRGWPRRRPASRSVPRWRRRRRETCRSGGSRRRCPPGKNTRDWPVAASFNTRRASMAPLCRSKRSTNCGAEAPQQEARERHAHHLLLDDEGKVGRQGRRRRRCRRCSWHDWPPPRRGPAADAPSPRR